ncbi:MAG TPA: hypothetical protein VF646_17520 [Cytophagales bacterium]|jgi:hypothetical protein
MTPQDNVARGKIPVFDVHEVAVEAGQEGERGLKGDPFAVRLVVPFEQGSRLLEKRLKLVRASQGSGSQFLHAHFRDFFFAQFGQYGGNVVGKHAVGREDEHVFGREGVAVPVEQEGDPVQGHRGFA